MGPSFSQLRLLAQLLFFTAMGHFKNPLSATIYTKISVLPSMSWRVQTNIFKTRCPVLGFSTYTRPPQAELSNFLEDKTSLDLFFLHYECPRPDTQFLIHSKSAQTAGKPRREFVCPSIPAGSALTLLC